MSHNATGDVRMVPRVRRIGVTLNDDIDQILRRAAPRHGDQAAFIRRAIIETATRDELRDAIRGEIDVMRQELHDARAGVYARLDRIEQILGIGDGGN